MAIHIRSGIENLRSLAEAIGLDPDAQKIISIKIEMSVKTIEVAIIELVVDTDQHNRLAEVLKQFTLVPKELDHEPPRTTR